MKKRSLWLLLLTVIGLTGIFTSCKSDENVDKINTLEVTPSSTIQFKASGNTPVTLSVKTDEKGTKAARRQAVVFDHITNITNKKAE